jgi:hypothetical protein
MSVRATLLSLAILIGVLVGPTTALAQPSSVTQDMGGAALTQLSARPQASPGSGILSASPSSLKFSPIPYTRGEREESQSETEQVNINGFEATVQIESVSIEGPDASSFSVQYGNCEDDQLSANNSCDAGIRFQPASPGDKHAELLIDSDSASGPLVVPLEGYGLLGPEVNVASRESQLGNVLLGAAASHSFTVENSGDYQLYIQQAFLVSGTPKMFPLLSNTCSGQIVLPGATCEFTIGFEPTTPGEKDASLIFITNATPQINVLGVDGVGTQPVVANPAAPSPDVVPQSYTAPSPPLKLKGKSAAGRQRCHRRRHRSRGRQAARRAGSQDDARRVGVHELAHLA